jgi:TetR/AcrR family fatty acid metabolism transcriptional regulator
LTIPGGPPYKPEALNERSFSRTTDARSPTISAPRQSPPNDKRRRILEAAVHVFAEHGFYNARVKDIAEEAGVADGTIYLYFKNKDDLLISLFEDRMDAILGRFRTELSRYPDAAGRVRRFIELHLGMVAEDPTLAEVLTVELRQSAKFMREYKAPKFGEYLDLLGQAIELGRQTGELRPDVDPAILKRALFGALDEVSMVWASSRRRPYELEQAADQLAKLCTRGLLADDGAPAQATGEKP